MKLTSLVRSFQVLATLQQQVEVTGIALVLSIKKQQAAAATWLSEAHFRDRGVGD